MRPISSTGDGDCLYNSLAIILFGDEKLALYLKNLTILELHRNWQAYIPILQFVSIAQDMDMLYNEVVLKHCKKG